MKKGPQPNSATPTLTYEARDTRRTVAPFRAFRTAAALLLAKCGCLFLLVVPLTAGEAFHQWYGVDPSMPHRDAFLRQHYPGLLMQDVQEAMPCLMIGVACIYLAFRAQRIDRLKSTGPASEEQSNQISDSANFKI
jgi:hypothetical protein